MLRIGQTGVVLSEENKLAIALAAKITAGNILNDRATKIIIPKIPIVARGYANTEIGKAVISNVVAGAIVHFAPTNQKAVLASQAMINSAMLNLAKSFNIEKLVNEFIDGINVEDLIVEDKVGTE